MEVSIAFNIILKIDISGSKPSSISVYALEQWRQVSEYRSCHSFGLNVSSVALARHPHDVSLSHELTSIMVLQFDMSNETYEACSGLPSSMSCDQLSVEWAAM
jgi:hypothetical protein